MSAEHTPLSLFSYRLIVSYAIADGRSNYMEGYILMNVFVLMSLAAWFVPDNELVSLFPDAYCSNPVLQMESTQSATAAVAAVTAI